MIREEALNSIKANVENEDMVKHMLAVEVIMRALARRLGEDEKEWSLTGLLHDIDIELIGEDMSSHGKLGADLVRELGASEAMVHAILCHDDTYGTSLETNLDKTLFIADRLYHLINAVKLASPDKKLANLSTKTVRGRFEEKDFVVIVNKEHLFKCREIGLELDEFIGLGLEAMQKAEADPGL